jgi:phosphoribosylformylglycinamidine cyclo-ligase
VPEGAEAVLGRELGPGDEIVLVASTGLHANGASLARALADGLPERWATPLPSRARFGDALLEPAPVYVPLVASLLAAGVPVRYLSHVTGHGLLKLMRPARDLGYVVRELPPVPEVLAFMVGRAGLDARAAHSTFNMGAGFAVYCAAGSGATVVEHAARLGLGALVAGEVVPGPRRVVLEPVGVVFEDDAMDLTPGR